MLFNPWSSKECRPIFVRVMQSDIFLTRRTTTKVQIIVGNRLVNERSVSGISKETGIGTGIWGIDSTNNMFPPDSVSVYWRSDGWDRNSLDHDYAHKTPVYSWAAFASVAGIHMKISESFATLNLGCLPLAFRGIGEWRKCGRWSRRWRLTEEFRP